MTIKAFAKTIPTTAAELLRQECALVIWDMQQAIAPRAIGWQELVPRVAALRAAARAVGIPVIYSQHFSLPLRFESSAYIHGQWRRSQLAAPDQLRPLALMGSAGWEFVAGLEPDADDIVLPKLRASFFIGTPLLQVLCGCHVSTLALTGVATDKDILGTARDAVHHGFHPVVVSDGVGAFTEDEQRLGLRSAREIAEVVATDEVLDVWRPDA